VSAYLLGAASALWLGVLTSISPCPLATNIAAVSFVGRRVESTRRLLLSGLLYTLGRLVVYLLLGVLLVVGLVKAPGVSGFLSRYLNQLLGPLLILTGMLMLELVKLGGKGWLSGEKLQGVAERAGIWGALLLGAVFALAFCPLSAGLFFMGLVPLAVKNASPVMYPALYGAGTAVPVIFFALVMAFSARSLSKAFGKVSAVEKWARWCTGAVFIVVGVYLSLRFIFEVF
jgi:cytochrome c biogenesis protein CcdA